MLVSYEWRLNNAKPGWHRGLVYNSSPAGTLKFLLGIFISGRTNRKEKKEHD
jgi:hypothetical protein